MDALRTLLRTPGLTHKEREYHISLNYQATEDNTQRRAGAMSFLAYLQSVGIPLAEVSKSDLKAWALTPNRDSYNVPNAQAFEGAKALCAFAAEVGHIDAQRLNDLATSTRLHFDVNSLRTVLQSSALTAKEREYQIRLNYQSRDNNTNRQAGASGLMAYPESQGKSLAEVTKSDLEEWALTPILTFNGNRTLPSLRAFKGAQALCALAAEVGYIDTQSAHAIAECTRPHFKVEYLRSVLENAGLTRKDRENQIRLNYQSSEMNDLRIGGANSILAYLESQASSLAEVTKSHLEKWALTRITSGHGKGTFPSSSAFAGAKALCALAAEVGYIDAQREAEIAACARPDVGGPSTGTVTASEAGAQVAESSRAILERMNKRPRTDDQGASTSSFHSFAFPQSDALQCELALSPQTASVLSPINELDSWDDILGSSGHLY